MQNLDLTPLEHTVKRVDAAPIDFNIKDSELFHPLLLYFIKVCFWMGTAGLVVGVIFVFMAGSPLSIFYSPLPLSLAIVSASVIAYFYFLRSYKRDMYLFAGFALANNMLYTPRLKNPNYAGSVFSASEDSGTVKDITISNTFFIDNNKLEIGNCNYTMELSGRRQVTTATFGYIRQQINNNVPHILVTSLKNAAPSIAERRVFDSRQLVELEGDFKSHFKVYCVKGCEIEALAILTPDVMATFIDSAADYDIEFIGNEWYIYKYGGFSLKYPQTWRALQSLIDTLNPQVYKQVRTVNMSSRNEMPIKLLSPQEDTVVGRLTAVIYWCIIILAVVFIIFILRFMQTWGLPHLA